ncbi:alpha-tocopherol transfer protein-like [Haematobia irritans]|uniref:alpha-tocopherol transfer protein-like n=1 Tax=Haematobia irritans TaxID=7368 RepID=UPI003F4FAB9B
MSSIKPLSKDLQKIAIEELNELPSRISQDLETLKTWIEKQPHLKARTADQWLIQFLRGCKYSVERAKEKIDLYFTLKTKYPEVFGFTDVDDPKFQEYFNLGCCLLLPKPLHGNGPRIVVGQLNYNSEDQFIENVFYAAVPMFELAMLNDPYAAVWFLEKSMPLRIRSVCFINVPKFSQQFFKLLLPLLSEKLSKRVHILGNDINELTQHIPLEYLPRNMGGSNGEYSELIREFSKDIQAHHDHFKENIHYGTIENLRPGKPIDLDGLFGIDGSFRKLSID